MKQNQIPNKNGDGEKLRSRYIARKKECDEKKKQLDVRKQAAAATIYRVSR